MNWHRKTVIKILLFVALLLEQDEDTKQAIIKLAQHIEVWAPKENA